MRGTARLSIGRLGRLRTEVQRPLYNRLEVRPGIVHVGVGAFHRAHQAVYVDDCLTAGETDWGIVGASLRSPDMRDALVQQDCLYSVSVEDGERGAVRVIGSILSLLVAPEDPAALLDALTDPGVRIVTLTVTEKAYLRDVSGALDFTHPDIAWDLGHPDQPRTVHGFIVEALSRRKASGAPLFTILSCDNLPSNGKTLKRLVVEFATRRDAGLGAFIEQEVAFPSSMVDRIVPATTDQDRERISRSLGAHDAWPVKTEPFMQWVIEENFPSGRPRWEEFGVEMVSDVEPYEDMKLRLLNGAHSAIAYFGLLMGKETIADSFADRLVREFVSRQWAEIIPTLPQDAGLDPEAYTQRLTRRFGNTALRHRTAQVGMDGSQKLPQRVIVTALERLEVNAEITHLMMVPAVWIAAAEQRGRTLPAGHFTDPLDAELAAIFAAEQDAGATVDAVFAAAGFAAGFSRRDHLVALSAKHLDALRRKGAIQTLSELIS